MNDFPHTMEISADPAAFAEKGFVILQVLPEGPKLEFLTLIPLEY